MDKHGTIEQMLEMIYTIKINGLHGAGLEALHELNALCEKLITIHAAQKRAPGHRMNGEKSSLKLVAGDHENST
jgi:hypothetical protein